MATPRTKDAAKTRGNERKDSAPDVNICNRKNSAWVRAIYVCVCAPAFTILFTHSERENKNGKRGSEKECTSEIVNIVIVNYFTFSSHLCGAPILLYFLFRLLFAFLLLSFLAVLQCGMPPNFVLLRSLCLWWTFFIVIFLWCHSSGAPPTRSTSERTIRQQSKVCTCTHTYTHTGTIVERWYALALPPPFHRSARTS